jgi:hypothetical protein
LKETYDSKLNLKRLVCSYSRIVVSKFRATIARIMAVADIEGVATWGASQCRKE